MAATPNPVGDKPIWPRGVAPLPRPFSPEGRRRVSGSHFARFAAVPARAVLLATDVSDVQHAVGRVRRPDPRLHGHGDAAGGRAGRVLASQPRARLLRPPALGPRRARSGAAGLPGHGVRQGGHPDPSRCRRHAVRPLGQAGVGRALPARRRPARGVRAQYPLGELLGRRRARRGAFVSRRPGGRAACPVLPVPPQGRLPSRPALAARARADHGRHDPRAVPGPGRRAGDGRRVRQPGVAWAARARDRHDPHARQRPAAQACARAAARPPRPPAAEGRQAPDPGRDRQHRDLPGGHRHRPRRTQPHRARPRARLPLVHALPHAAGQGDPGPQPRHQRRVRRRDRLDRRRRPGRRAARPLRQPLDDRDRQPRGQGPRRRRGPQPRPTRGRAHRPVRVPLPDDHDRLVPAPRRPGSRPRRPSPQSPVVPPQDHRQLRRHARRASPRTDPPRVLGTSTPDDHQPETHTPSGTVSSRRRQRSRKSSFEPTVCCRCGHRSGRSPPRPRSPGP